MATRCVSRGCLHLTHHVPAVRIFLNLAAASSRRSLSTEAPFDFLAPSISTQAVKNGPQLGMRSPLQSQIRGTSRAFSSYDAKRQTAAIFNPRKDEDGIDMIVEITPRAATRLSQIMAKDSNPNLALRIQVESGGCHGFQYLMSLTTLPPVSKDAGIDEDDTVFEAADDTGAKVVMDGPSLELLKGSKVDFTMELIGSQFKIVDNPLATSSCGCGTSFDIKI